MNRQQTNNTKKQLLTRISLIALAALLGVGVLFGTQPVAKADRFDDQINAIEQEIGQFQAEASRLRAEGDSLQNAVNALTAQKTAIQKQIDLAQVRYDKLLVDIKNTEERIARSQAVLGDTVADLYIDSSVTPIELLASSGSIGDFIDKQEYRTSVGDQLQKAIDEIRKLRTQLEAQRDKVELLLTEQKSQRDQLAAKEAEQANLLAQTRGNEAEYGSLVEARRAELREVESEQQAAYAAIAADARRSGSFVTIGGSGSYPWAGVGYPCWSFGCDDPWGLYYRECTSYVAWKLDATGRAVQHFGGRGNAYEWPGTTSGYTSQSSSPSVGTAAVAPAGGYYGVVGHVMYVEEVRGDGSIRVSEYNLAGPGQYSERVLSQSEYKGNGFRFITFPGR